MQESVVIKNLDHLGLIATMIDELEIGDTALFIQKGLEAIKEKKIDFISRVPMRIKDAKAFITYANTDDFTSIDKNYSYIEKNNHLCRNRAAMDTL